MTGQKPATRGMIAAMTEAAIPVTHRASPPRVWDTGDVPAAEAFDYYREGICACFMPLRPELAHGARGGFRSVVRSWEMPSGALNMVSARAHDVLRTRAEIAASPGPAVYVNLQLDGICTIRQQGRTFALSPGQVGVFDADTPFALDHSQRPGLRVASFLVPRAALPGQVAPGASRLSDHPLYGGLLTEAAHALVRAAGMQDRTDQLHGLFLSLVAMSVDLPEPDPATAAAAQRARIHAVIRANAARPGWRLTDCAAELGLSTRQIQRLLADDDDGFAAALTRARLVLAAHMLRDPAHRHRPVADIALAVGYAEPAPFARAFRAAFGAPPGAWRKQ